MLLKEPRLIGILADGDERYGIHIGMHDYLRKSTVLSYQLACPVNIAGLIMCIATANSSPTNHGTIELGTVQRFTYLHSPAPCIAVGFPLTVAIENSALMHLL